MPWTMKKLTIQSKHLIGPQWSIALSEVYANINKWHCLTGSSENGGEKGVSSTTQ
jgi:hypothetical protein